MVTVAVGLFIALAALAAPIFELNKPEFYEPNLG